MEVNFDKNIGRKRSMLTSTDASLTFTLAEKEVDDALQESDSLSLIVEMEEPPSSMTAEGRADYWREMAAQQHRRNAELQRDYDDHTQMSSMLEKELETTLDQKERTIRDLRAQNQKIDRELDFAKKKMDRFQQENGQLEAELKQLKNEKERHLSYIRELEQKNDDLERGQRVISESVAGIEALLNEAYEKNAELENNMDEMENLKIKLQRITDEARDLKQELHVKEVVPNGNVSAVVDSNKKTLVRGAVAETETQTSGMGTPLKAGDISTNGNTLTPSSRISALNIVGDLLRKVGLERFLCSECSKVRCVCVKNETMLRCRGSSVTSTDSRKIELSTLPKMAQSEESITNKSNGKNSSLISKMSDGSDKPFGDNSNSQVDLRRNSLVKMKEENNLDSKLSPPNDADRKSLPPSIREKSLAFFTRNSSIRRTSTTPPKPPPRSPSKSRVIF